MCHLSRSSFTADYADGQSARVLYELQQVPTGARLRAGERQGDYAPPPRDVYICVRRVDHRPGNVRLDGLPLAARESEAALRAAAEGWFYDYRDLSLVVMFADRSGFQLDMTYDPTLIEDAPPVRVGFRVHVPDDTPRDQRIHIATSGNDWAHAPLEWSADGAFAEGEVPLPRGRWFEYKFSRGNWGTVERWNGCAQASNRYGFAAAHPIREDRVETWEDWCDR